MTLRKKRFIPEMQLAWLYRPNEVIRSANGFLTAISTSATPEQRGHIDATGRAFLVSLRSDLLGKTELGPSDFFIGSAAR